MFVESPQLAICAPAFVQDDGGQFGLRVMTNPLGDSMKNHATSPYHIREALNKLFFFRNKGGGSVFLTFR